MPASYYPYKVFDFIGHTIVDDLNKILRTTWDAEKWILEGWTQISSDEKFIIKSRMDELFKNGLPFEMKYDKLFYIYTFSLLAQLEVLAVQIPLKFEKKMRAPKFQKAMRSQLLDEIFHGMVFTKIVYLLCSPYSFPPPYNAEVETLCNFVRNENCPKVGVVLLNLVGEGWIEEIFKSLYRQNVAPQVFSIIIDDEHRHVNEADLYRDIGLPDMNVVKSKLEFLEEQLAALFSQYKYVASMSTLLGIQGNIDFIESLDRKHRAQLAKIGLVPGKKWQSFLDLTYEALPRIKKYTDEIKEIQMTPTRQMLMTQWDNPSDPTMVGEFDIDVSCLDFFNKKFPPETITTLILQVISQGLADNDSFRNFLNHKKLYQSKSAYVAVVVKLPDCGDHIGNIAFENCHNMSFFELSNRIRLVVEMMSYCYKKREELEKKHPQLKTIVEGALFDFNYGTYAYPLLGSSMVTLSNIGSCGYVRTKSPLRSNESMKYTLLAVERKQVWNKYTHTFEVQDILPISISADHRIFDGNLPIPKIVSGLFQQMFQRMVEDKEKQVKNPAYVAVMSGVSERAQGVAFNTWLDEMIVQNVEVGYKALTILQNLWPDFVGIDEFIYNQIKKDQGIKESAFA